MSSPALPYELIAYIQTIAKILHKRDLFNDIRSHGRSRELKQETLTELCQAVRSKMGLEVAHAAYPAHAPLV